MAPSSKASAAAASTAVLDHWHPGPKACDGRCPAIRSWPGEQGEPVAHQVESGNPPRLQPVVSQPPAEVPLERLGRLLPGAAGLGAAPDVVLSDRAAFSLIGFQQRGPGPATQHPGQLPAEVERILDGRVHSGPAPGRHPMRSVADEEAPPVGIPLRELRGEGERAELLQLHVQPGHSGRRADQGDQLVGWVVDQTVLARAPLPGEAPASGRPPRRQHALSVRMGDDIQAVATVTDHVGQAGH